MVVPWISLLIFGGDHTMQEIASSTYNLNGNHYHFDIITGVQIGVDSPNHLVLLF